MVYFDFLSVALQLHLFVSGEKYNNKTHSPREHIRMVTMMKGMAVALGPLGIRVNAVGPGVTVTDMAKNYLLGDREALEAALSRTPLSRLAEPSEIASCVAFLASEDATYVNGQTLYVVSSCCPLTEKRSPLPEPTWAQVTGRQWRPA